MHFCGWVLLQGCPSTGPHLAHGSQLSIALAAILGVPPHLQQWQGINTLYWSCCFAGAVALLWESCRTGSWKKVERKEGDARREKRRNGRSHLEIAEHQGRKYVLILWRRVCVPVKHHQTLPSAPIGLGTWFPQRRDHDFWRWVTLQHSGACSPHPQFKEQCVLRLSTVLLMDRASSPLSSRLALPSSNSFAFNSLAGEFDLNFCNQIIASVMQYLPLSIILSWVALAN